MGGNIPCALNAANEVAVGAFLDQRISFIALSDLIGEVLQKSEYIKDPSLDDLIFTNEETRIKTELLIDSNHF